MVVHTGNRYGRSEEARRNVLQEADDLVVAVGLEATTIEEIARRAGVAKQTIYRWWRDKNAVLLDVVIRDTELKLDLPDTGSLPGDVTQMCANLTEFLIHDDAGAVLLSLRAQAITNRAFGEVFRTRFWEGQVAREQEPLRRAVGRRELPEDTDIDHLRLRIVGPLYAAAEEGLLDRGFSREHSRAVLAALG
ncbi:TetR/AcrR family transcriptional regulator [Acidipropionibacterium jensenii]|uniref:TetR/AcrR family transcriptional regulator n=1 Tax=Acidipropionibacterium jensenii TaxID=1749 RepID=UPI00214C7B6B|nr:TetR/AcrR family transcriptional regulator [Acidipropionibacterium jensenii]